MIGAVFVGGLLLAKRLGHVLPAEPQRPPSFAATVNEITERTTTIVREEIELAKAGSAQKSLTLCAGQLSVSPLEFLLLAGSAFFLRRLSRRSQSLLFKDVFWGFLVVAGGLFLLAGLAGLLAARFLKGGSPPTPAMAIDEARRMKEAVTSGGSDESAAQRGLVSAETERS